MQELVQGRSLRQLVVELAYRLRGPRDPFFPDIIIVPSVEMARWVRLAVAECNDGLAHFKIELAGSFLWTLFRKLVPDLPPVPLSQQSLTMATAEVISDPILVRKLSMKGLEFPSFDSDPLWHYNFSRKMADLLDRVIIHRPNRILSWEKGDPSAPDEPVWIGDLWKSLAVVLPTHRALLAETLRKALSRPFERRSIVDLYPSPVHVFGHPLLPRVQIELFAELSRPGIEESGADERERLSLDMVFYHWSFSREYSGYERRRRKEDLPSGTEFPTNRLFRVLGRQKRAMEEIFLETVTQWSEPGVGEETRTGSLLADLQEDVWNDRPCRGGDCIPGPGDESLQIHSCRNSVQEVEVLYHFLMDLFRRDPSLRPSDVLVMAPDIGLYRPFIESVFLSREDRHSGNSASSGLSAGEIPFTISGDSKEDQLWLDLDRLLALVDSPWTLRGVLAPLESPRLRACFGLEPEDFPVLERLLEAAGVLWGMDGETRRRFDSPEAYRNTFRYGLDRLFFSMCRETGDPNHSVLAPVSDFEPVLWPLFERLLAYLDRLVSLRDRMKGKHSLSEWAVLFLEILSDFFGEEGEPSPVRSLLEEFKDGNAFGQTLLWDLPSVRKILGAEHPRIAGRRALLSGRSVWFSEMVPLRGIPFRVIWILGMGGEDFPRMDHPLSFDFMGRSPLPGERSFLEDDNALFLESFLAAESVFGVSFPGQEGEESSERLPASPVSLLLETIEAGYGGAETVSRILRVHDDEVRVKELSPDEDRVVRGGVPFWTGPEVLEPVVSSVRVKEVVRFLSNPSQWFLNRWGSVRIPWSSRLREDAEPFWIDTKLERLWNRFFLEEVLGSEETERRLSPEILGSLPHGVPGEWIGLEVTERQADFRQHLLKLRLEGYKPSQLTLESGEKMLEIPVRGVPLRFTGTIRCWYREEPGGMMFPCDRDPDGKTLLSIWFLHLSGLSAGFRGPSRILFWKENSWKEKWLKIPPNPRALLSTIAALFLEGQKSPVPFFPGASLAYAKSFGGVLPMGSESPPYDESIRERRLIATEKALEVWTGKGGDHVGLPEGAYVDNRFLYRTAPPFSRLTPEEAVSSPLSDFERYALEIAGPLLSCLQGSPSGREDP
ncbi:MAG: exodeoxyribonuclease V subunit gamma [Leptospirales bacterium]